MATGLHHREPPTDTGPVWQVAELLPEQGHWSERDYLYVTRSTRRLVELADGRLEFPPMPTRIHQDVVACLYLTLLAFLQGTGGGRVWFAPLRVRLSPGHIREPDVVVMLTENLKAAGNDAFDGADLVVEVVSDDEPSRDWVTKRREYAAAGIREYWIADPRTQELAVLTLQGGVYVEHGRFAVGTLATSPLLPGLTVDVAAVFRDVKRNEAE